jgi:hypothetical protein
LQPAGSDRVFKALRIATWSSFNSDISRQRGGGFRNRKTLTLKRRLYDGEDRLPLWRFFRLRMVNRVGMR